LQGDAKGEKQGRYELARNLLAMGFTLEVVIQATGFSKDDIDQLA
jgi:predicted transposase/invertase (TIGR01784 family)